MNSIRPYSINTRRTRIVDNSRIEATIYCIFSFGIILANRHLVLQEIDRQIEKFVSKNSVKNKMSTEGRQ